MHGSAIMPSFQLVKNRRRTFETFNDALKKVRKKITLIHSSLGGPCFSVLIVMFSFHNGFQMF